MSVDIRRVKDMNGLITYLAEKLSWRIDLDDFEDIEDIAYDFEAEDIGLKEEAFVKIQSLRQLPPLVDGQKWGIFCVEFDSKRFEVTALRKILSGLIPKRRNSADHAVWDQKDLLFICFWGSNNERTIGLAHFEDVGSGLPQIKMISCCPSVEDFTQIKVFEDRLKNLKWPANYVDHNKWQEDWSNAFTTGYKQTIQDASTLTVQLAIEAQGIKNRILEILDVETANGYVHLLYDKFKNTLIHDMTETQFADMYAQTVVYGLFSARCMDDAQGDFSATEAVDYIPNTNPFLKSLMKECLGSQNNSKLSFDELEIGNVVDLLLHTKTEAIIQDFNRQTGGGREDPVLHFYEEFLTAYDKDQKVQRGVYYTPQPVVNFIVRAVDYLIKSEFGLEDGLASTKTKKIKYFRESKKRVDRYFRTQVEDTMDVPTIQVLDPSTGTGTFIRQAILQIFENFQKKNGHLKKEDFVREWNEYVPKHLLPRLNAFELMMAPYAVAHMKLAMVLKDTGYNFSGNSRLKVYLTNALEEPGNDSAQISLFDDPLAIESIEANNIKKNAAINIIIGNPPYAGKSANNGEWISALIEDYKKEPGGKERLKERNPKYVNDDYVKFIRLSQWYLDKGGSGIMGFICPHGFIDNPTFRGMRWQLASSFTDIYVLDLHGNAKKKEVAEDGSKDENVFDIQQGVCLLFLVKKPSRKESSFATIYHADLYGTRNHKYNYLNNKTFQEIKWNIVNCEPSFYLFKPSKVITNSKANRFNVSNLFQESVAGVKTHRDFFAISFDKKTMEERINDMRNPSYSDNYITTKYGLKDTTSWTISSARTKIQKETEDYIAKRLTRCQYRIFDCRWCYLDDTFVDRPRSLLIEHVANKDNYVFGVGRQGLAVGDIEWCLATVSKYPIDENIYRRGGVLVSPLYKYDSNIFARDREPNLNKEIVHNFEECTGLGFSSEKQDNNILSFAPIDIMDYIYAILYSHKYREAYADELKIDYPKVPYPTESDYFWKIVDFGKKLRLLHTQTKRIDCVDIVFKGDGNNCVEQYKVIDNKIHINKKQYFQIEGQSIQPEWDYIIGGNQPLQKWLKDRKKLFLTKEDIQQYREIIGAIRKTINIMNEIDDIIII